MACNFPRYPLAFSSQVLEAKAVPKAGQFFYSFLFDNAEIFNIVHKVALHGKKVAVVQKIFQRSRQIQRNRIEALCSLSELVRNTQLTHFISKSSNLKPKQKQQMTQHLSKVRGLKKETMREICEKAYRLQKLRNVIQDVYWLKLRMEERSIECSKHLQSLPCSSPTNSGAKEEGESFFLSSFEESSLR